MFENLNWNMALDGWIVVAGVLCAVASALLGNFLVLRRMSLLGDAISHAVLPGLAAAFFFSSSRSSMPMFLGAVLTGILTALLTEWIRGLGKVDEGASMGVVFTTLFALGLVMIVQAADHVDLDPGCVLYGAIELTPLDTVRLAGHSVPRVVLNLSAVLVLNLLFILMFWKELKLSSFDPVLATTTGFNARVIHYLLMTLVAVTSVASFESVGNILVVAMFVVPPSAAYLLTDRLGWMVVISVLIAGASGILGHIGALVIPSWFGFHSTSTAPMMATSAGALFVLAAVFAPRHGILMRFLRQRMLSWKIFREDILALLFRLEEKSAQRAVRPREIQQLLFTGRLSISVALHWQRIRGLLREKKGAYELTVSGRQKAESVIRAHRLWEQYLVERADIPRERIHDKAERFEHFTDARLRSRLDDETSPSTVDPHGSIIPVESMDHQDVTDDPESAS
jgi:manganese/zinc/iron transport system permease protein